MNLLRFDQDMYKCLLCMDKFTDPVVATDGMIYCEPCIKQWKKTNSKSPYDKGENDNRYKSIDGWYKSSTIDNLFLSVSVFTDLNLLKLIDNDEIVFEKFDEAQHVIDAIDLENHYRLIEDVDRISVLKKIFANVPMVKQILLLLNESNPTWKGLDGWTIAFYIFRFSPIELIEYLLSECEFDLNVPTKKGWHIIDIACSKANGLSSNDQYNVIKWLIDKKVNFETRNPNNEKPIHCILLL